jgi:hypothetical protein
MLISNFEATKQEKELIWVRVNQRTHFLLMPTYFPCGLLLPPRASRQGWVGSGSGNGKYVGDSEKWVHKFTLTLFFKRQDFFKPLTYLASLQPVIMNLYTNPIIKRRILNKTTDYQK